jgi:hypothetical protein
VSQRTILPRKCGEPRRWRAGRERSCVAVACADAYGIRKDAAISGQAGDMRANIVASAASAVDGSLGACGAEVVAEGMMKGEWRMEGCGSSKAVRWHQIGGQ